MPFFVVDNIENDFLELMTCRGKNNTKKYFMKSILYYVGTIFIIENLENI